MLNRLRTSVARLIAPVAVRRFDGASNGNRWNAAPTFGSINAEVLAAAEPLRRRAAYLFRNNAWMAGASETLGSSIVGSGIRPTSKHPDPAVRKALQNAFAAWTATCDVNGTSDFYGLQSQAVRGMIEAGETFIQLVTPLTASNVPLRLRLIDAELIDLSNTRNQPNGSRLVGGIEFDAEGGRVAYHVGQRIPTDLFSTTATPTRIPAADMAHLFNPIAAGQVRGVSWAAPVLTRVHELDALEDALLVQQKIASLFGGFITDPSADPAINPFVDQTTPVPQLEPGAMQSLPAGWDVKFSTPREASEGTAFVKSQLRAIAAGLGMPDFALTGDLSEVNYSSIRAGLVQFRRRIEALQYNVVIHQFCRPVWERFVTLAVLSGTVEAPDFESRTQDYLAAEWYPPAQEWVDPLKDSEADAAAVAAGFVSRRQVVARQGYDIEAVDAEIAADRAREKALGLSFTLPVPPSTGGAAA